MIRLGKEDRAGLYLTVILHLAVVIVLLATGLDRTIRGENSFILDFTKYEEREKMLEELEKLQRQAELQQAIADKLQQELGDISAQSVRNVAVDRASLKDDRGTDAEQLYKDAERLAKDLKQGFSTPDEDHVAVPSKKSKTEEGKQARYSGPSVVSYDLGGRKASHLPIPAYRCMGAGEVKVLITVDNSGKVTGAKVDPSCSSQDGCLQAYAIRASRLSRFSASPSSPKKHEGYIIYKFVAQ